MKKVINCLFLCLTFYIVACQDDPIQDLTEEDSYFPDLNSGNWETSTPESLNWNTSAVNDLYDFLETNKSRGFILVKNGRIVLENYWGNDILNTTSFGENTNWYWASASKTISAFLIGVAQQDGLLDIEDSASDYLGEGWTNMELTKENLITVKHQLTMTTGLDYTQGKLDCTDKDCLNYAADPDTQWYYHNAPYTLLQSIIEQAANTGFQEYTDEKIGDKIGMHGAWIQLGENNVYWSTAREAARYGLLIANQGQWKNEQILNDVDYFNAMVNPSQNLNPSYGYLWWLNGQQKITFPGSPISFSNALAPNAPVDLIAAMGKNGQFIDIVPSQNLVVIRFGEAPNDNLVPIEFHDEMWKKIMGVIN